MSPPKPAPRRSNPFVGPLPLTSDDALYGRDREVDRLLDQLVADRIVLLYAPSGAGKTSLIQAGLVPRLREDGFTVLPLPPARVGLEPPPDTSLPPHNRYQLSVLLGLDRTLPPAQQRPAAELAGMSLKSYLQGWPGRGDKGRNLVLLFDQFEELCALDSTDLPAKAEFMTRLGSVLRDPSVWALLAMREEYVTMLDPYLARFPTRLSSTFRLDFLDQYAARRAIQQPVAAYDVTFEDEAATRLVDDLRRVRVDRPDGSTRVLGPWVEPVQLQVVCRQLWEQLPPGKDSITEEDIANAGDIDRALSLYYEKQIQAVVAKTGIDEGDLRKWIDDKLVTERGLRDQTSRGPGKGGRKTERALELLTDAHVIRAERRRDVTWYELTHDRLIEPVQESNKWWWYENRGWLGPAAEGSKRSGRPAEVPPAEGMRLLTEGPRIRPAPQKPAAERGWAGTTTVGISLTALIALALILVWRLESPSPLYTQRTGILILAGLAVWALSIFPGWLYVRFLDVRVRALWTEYVLNLHRLGPDRPGFLPKPPVSSEFYVEWFDDNGALFAQEQNIYRQKFEAYYGKSASQIHERGRFKIRVDSLFPVVIATATFALCWAAVLPGTRFITHPATTWDVLKYGFLGCYVFVTGMLVRRFFRNDLRPSSYVTAVYRIVLVLLLVAVLNQVVAGGSAAISRPELAVAFVIGLVPLGALRPLLRAASNALRDAKLGYPLDHLDGINWWYEARLSQEGVEDLQGLTVMNLVDAMLHTRIPPGRLLDWADQAFLLIHLERSDREKLRRLGIRTATDALKAFSVEPDETSGAQPRRVFRLPEDLTSPLPVDQLRLLVPILGAEAGLAPVWNWQQRGQQQRRSRARESVLPEYGREHGTCADGRGTDG